MARPVEFDRDQARRRALELFWRRGYHATSLEDLLTELGISRSSFYQSFRAKRALFEACLAIYTQDITQALARGLAEAATARDFLMTILLGGASVDGRQGRCGCLVMNTASEFAQRDPEITSRVSEATEQWREILERAVLRLGEEERRPIMDPAVSADLLLTGLAGLKAMAKAGLPPGRLEGVARRLLEGLVN